MKIVQYLTILVFLASSCYGQRNVILIIADDIGTDYCGFYENYADTVNMPNIRKLLNKGVRFTNAMSNPVCSSTRAGIFTGRYSFRTGVGISIGEAHNGAGQLDTSEISLPRLMKQYSPSGIAMAQIGKWHLNQDTPATNMLIPNLMGYDYYSGNFRALVYDYYNWKKITNGLKTNCTTYATTETANNAVSWIKAQNNKPFFLWLAFNAPHGPFHLPPPNLHSYSGLSGTQQDILQNPKPYYMAAMEALDHEVGRIFDSLQVFGKMDSTDFIFIGDNGDPKPVSQSIDSTRNKGTIYQQGIHVPFIIAGPSVINPGRTSDALVNTHDLFATILELAGDSIWQSQLPLNTIVDSKSIMPIIRNHATQIRSWAFTEIFNASAINNDGKAIRNSSYKLLHFDNGKKEFYNLAIDANELNNLLESSISDVDYNNYAYLCNELNILLDSNSACNSIITAAATITPAGCSVPATGAIALIIEGADYPYTYLWSDGATIKNRTGLTAGTYSITITDAASQKRTFSYLINVISTGNIPAKPSLITGPVNGVCASTANVTYTTVVVNNASSYLWTAPINTTIISGQGTTSVTINFGAGFTSGVLGVSAINNCGISQARTITIRSTPFLQGTITGPSAVCANQNNVMYSVLPVSGVISYNWTNPSGSTIINGQGTNNISVQFGTSAGSIKVKANNLCGVSNTKSLNVSMPCRESENDLNTISELGVYPNPAHDKLNIRFISKLNNTYNLKITDLTGRVIQTSVNKANTDQNETILKLEKELSGIYLLILEINGKKEIRKIALY